MTSFSASPSAITEGDKFTLTWAAPCGFVSIGIKGQPQFALNQSSNGSYELKPGLTGYPSATGTTVYEATNGDAAPRLSTTVTVNPRPTPTPAPNRAPTVSVTASASTCHPLSPTQPCTVTCSASASDPDGDSLGYSWSGCASGSGPSATCAVSNLTAFTCSVNVSDGRGGAATGSASVTGVNHAPNVAFYSGPFSQGSTTSAFCGTGADVFFDFVDADNEFAADAQGMVVSGPCTFGMVTRHNTRGQSLWVAITLPPTPQSCQVAARAADGWGYTSWVNSPVFTCQ